MRNLGRLSLAEAVAAGDHATAEPPARDRRGTRVSEDGRWWWDGSRWVAAATPDGLWRWDGRRWQPTVPLDGVRPWELAGTLALLAEDRYARAAAILVDRAREWRPDGELRDLVGRAIGMRHRLGRLGRALAGGPQGIGDLVRRLAARPRDRQQLAEQQALLDTEYRALAVRVGRRAPRPTVKEADEILEVARLLDRRAARLTDGLSAMDEAERARARAIGAAQRTLKEAEAGRRAALQAARRALEDAEADRAEAVEAARDRVRAALAPSTDGPLAEVGAMRAFREVVRWPAGGLRVHGLTAGAGTAYGLWRRHRDLLTDLVLLDTPEAGSFTACLAERRDDVFVLLHGRSRALFWPCPAGAEKAARRFVTTVNRLSRRAAAMGPDQEAEVRRACEEGGGPASSAAAEAARAELARVEADPELLRPIEAARERLDRARSDPPALVEARLRVAEETGRLAVPPPPLAAAEVAERRRAPAASLRS